MFFGRVKYLQAAQQGIDNPQSAYRSFFLLGTRGSGKTVLLHQIAELARGDKWSVCETHSSSAAAALKSFVNEAGAKTRKRVAVEPKLSLPDGTAASAVEIAYENERQGATLLSTAIVEYCSRLKRSNGLLIAIDEAQKLPEKDAVEICNAVQAAKTQGLSIMLVLAGLPNAKERIGGFDGCTFMKRAESFVLKPLTRSETYEALETLFARVPEIALSDAQLDEIAHFTQGHPYLVQLAGHHIYEGMERAYGPALGTSIASAPLGDGDLAAALESAYWSYRENVLSSVLEELSETATLYLEAMISTMDDRGIMETGKAAAEVTGKMSPGETGYFRDRLIKLCLIQPVERGKARFLLPYLPRALREKNLEIIADAVDEDDWLQEV